MPRNEKYPPFPPREHEHTRKHKLEPEYCAIGLNNPKTPSNVGSVLRACACFGADEIFYTGVRYERAQRFNTNTADARTPLSRVNTFTEISHPGLQTVCVELVEDAIPLQDFTHPAQALYIFGPEDYNLTQKAVDQSDHVVFIPTGGSLNLAAAVNILLYDRTTKANNEFSTQDYNNMVRNSRDCRNNLRRRELI